MSKCPYLCEVTLTTHMVVYADDEIRARDEAQCLCGSMINEIASAGNYCAATDLSRIHRSVAESFLLSTLTNKFERWASGVIESEEESREAANALLRNLLVLCYDVPPSLSGLLLDNKPNQVDETRKKRAWERFLNLNGFLSQEQYYEQNQ